MARGTGKVEIIGANRTGQEHGLNDFVYDVTTAKSPLYNVGDRVLLPNGKVFYHSYSGGMCYTGRGNVFYNTISSSADGIDYSVLAEAAAAGDRSVLMTNQGTAAITLDQFRNGQIVLKPTESTTDAELMFRGVVGNTADASTGHDGTVRIYLDAKLTVAMLATNYAFVMPSPYTDIRYESTSGKKSFAGPAAAYVSAAGRYFWTQTWGMCWIAPQTDGPGTVAYNRSVYWRHDGTVDCYSCDSGTFGTSDVTDQRAGFIMDNNADDNGATLICLQVNI